jgi:hypothetical protein
MSGTRPSWRLMSVNFPHQLREEVHRSRSSSGTTDSGGLADDDDPINAEGDEENMMEKGEDEAEASTTSSDSDHLSAGVNSLPPSPERKMATSPQRSPTRGKPGEHQQVCHSYEERNAFS